MADRVRAGFRTIAGLGAGAVRSGLLHPIRPDRALRLALPVVRYGTTPATLSALAALRFPGRTAVIDEAGSVTFGELERRAAALAAALSALVATAPRARSTGAAAGDEAPAGAAPPNGPPRIGIMCRNHRGFIEAMLAGSRIGHDVVLLNTDFSAPQLESVLARENVGLLVLDEEYLPVADEADFTGPRVIAWSEGVDGSTGVAGPASVPKYPTIDDLVEITEPAPGRPGRTAKLVILTSGTTGTPKGAQHDLSVPALVPSAIAHLVTIPLRSGEPVLIAPPLYHVLGLGYLTIALALGSPVVLLRRFDPGAALRAIERHRAGTLVGVPLMLQRILETATGTGDATASAHTSASDSAPNSTSATASGPALASGSLRVVVSGGSALQPHLAERFRAAFGDVLYNVYGATETGWATIATPADLRAAPGTVGRVSWGVTLKLLDTSGDEVPPGEIGRVFFGGGGINFTGYTGGGGKETAERLVATGDLAHFDEAGRLFIDGRVDDMIISGGENVFPGEVEDLLAGHEGVAEAAVTGADDPEYGQRLVAHVVRAPGSAVTGDELRAYVKSRLTRYKVPREVRFVDELPRTTTGKIRRGSLSDGTPGEPAEEAKA